jgi:hypothetical protein
MGFLAIQRAQGQQAQQRPPNAIGDVRQPNMGGGFWSKAGGFLKRNAIPIASLAAAPFTGGLSLAGLASGGAAIAGTELARHAQSSAMKRSPEEQTALTGAQGSATGLQQGGQSLVKQGQSTVESGLNTLQQPTNYWSKLLGGNRASMAQATAAPRGAITDIYRGAERGVERSGVRGAARDVQKGELNRQRAGQIAGLTTGVQPAAAESLANIGAGTASLGGQLSGQGGSMMGAGGNIFSNLLGQGQANRQYGRAEGEKAGGGIGSFLFDIIRGISGKGGGGGMTDKVGKIGDIPGLFKGQGQWS